MRKILSPTFIVPIVLTVAVIAALLAISNVGAIFGRIIDFPRANLLWFGIVTLVYEVVRCVQWNYLLRALHIDAPLRSQVYAFALNEFSRNLPVGSYFQNYLLQQSTGADFGETSAATTLILVSEVVICLIGVVILGLGAWSAEARTTILVGSALVLLFIWAYSHLHQSPRMPKWVKEHKSLRKAVDEIRRFRDGTVSLFHPRILVIQGLLGAAYLVLASVGLYLVARGLDPHDPALAFSNVLAVYLFTLATAAIFPVPEVGGVGAFLAYGVSRNVAVGAMLLNRAMSVGFSIISVVVVTAALPGELRAILQARRKSPVSHDAHDADARSSSRLTGK